jgi:protein TonB
MILAATPPTASVADRLGSTLFVAALAHGVVILGVTFAGDPFAEQTDPPALSVTLLVDTNSLAESHADLLASQNAIGGGRSDDASRPTTTLSANHPMTQLGDALGADLERAKPRESAPEADQLVSRNPADRRVQAVPEATESPAPVPMRAAALLQQANSLTLAAEIDDRVRSQSSDADSPLESPSARESTLAAYLVGWRQRVERIGTANFPADYLANRKSSLWPILEVEIGADGELEGIVVRRSSGDAGLDQAALQILRMAAPFEPLPASILAERDVLRFAYEWDFSAG